jgi:hypothetical protein
MGGAYIAHFAMYATLENRTHGKKRPCVRHPDYLYTYLLDSTLQGESLIRGLIFAICHLLFAI